MTDAQRKRAWSMRSDGELISVIAAELEVPYSTVHQYLTDPTGSKARTRKKRYAGKCLVCGGATSGTKNGLAKTPRFCVAHGKEYAARKQRRARDRRRKRVEGLWAAGLTLRQIAKEMDWTLATAHVQIVQMRADGADLPYRYSPERVANIQEGIRHAREMKEKETTALAEAA